MADDESWLSEYVEHINRVGELKTKMRDRGLTQAKAHCPACGGRDTLQLRLTPNRRSNGALRWWCTNEPCQFQGME